MGRHRVGHALALWAGVGGVLAGAPFAQAAERPMAERYARASNFLLAPVLRALKNNTVIPHWIGDGDRFWYAREGAGGSEFVVVDAATGARSAAFDSGGVAKALTILLKQEVAASSLPFKTFDYSAAGDQITFDVKDAKVRCTVRTSVCERLGAAAAAGPELIVSPDHGLAVFQRGGNLILRDLATGVERALTQDGAPEKGWGVGPAPSDFRGLQRQIAGGAAKPFRTVWSPDSRRLITVFTDITGVEPYPYVEYAPADGSFRPKARSLRYALPGEQAARVQLYSIDVVTGARRPIDLTGAQVEFIETLSHAGAWAKDNRHYLLFSTATDQSKVSLLDIDALTGAVREVIGETSTYPALLAAGAYDTPNGAVLKGGAEAIWSSQRDGWPHLYLYDVASGRVKRRLTSGPWVVRHLVKVDEARGQVYFVASGREGGDPYFRSLYRVGLDGKGLTRLTPETPDKPLVNPEGGPGFDGALPYQPVSPSGRYIVYGVSPLCQPTTTLLRRTDGGGAPVVVEKGDAAALFAAGYRPPEAFTATAADGKSALWGVVYRPSDYDARKRYPVLTAEYNSPSVTIVPRNFSAALTTVIETAPPAADAELGFIVVMVDARGTPYRGAAFSTPWPGYLATMGLEDHVAALKQLAARDPSMDMSRVGITGASFGGWTAIRALERFNDTYKVGVAWAPPGNFQSLYAAPGLTGANGQALYAGGATRRPAPNAAPINWRESDSTAQIGLFKGKLLLGSGALDENVPPGSPMQFMDAAAKANKDVEQIFLPNANHGPLTYWPYVTRRVWDFLVLNLAKQAPPADFPVPAEAFRLPGR